MLLSNLPKPANQQNAKFGQDIFKNDSSIPPSLVAAVFGNSPYLSKIIEKEPEFFANLCKIGFDKAFEQLISNLKTIVLENITKAELMVILRVFKRKLSLIVALADISNNWDLKKVTSALSDFADISVKLSVEFLLQDRFKQKLIKSALPEESGIVVLAVGKLGGHELNYSSDIDIVVLYNEDRVSYQGKLSIKEFVVRWTQELVEILQTRNSDGYVFRVDLRIRPDPFSTPVAVSMLAAEQYYKTVGQNWERAALIKARFIAGDEFAADSFLHFLDKFIWRVNLNFNALEDIKSVKRQIDSSHTEKPESLFGYNVKLGRGAIREIEFYAQTQQLIWGGREGVLRKSSTCEALIALEKGGKIPAGTAAKLIDAYEYFRKTEHRLQMVNDEHTHDLPKTEEDLKNFSVFMGYDSVKDFQDELSNKAETVRKEYAHLFEESPSLSMGGNLVFTGVGNDPETLLTLSKLSFQQPETVAEIIRGWHYGRHPSTAHQRVREILTELVPHILRSFGGSNNPDEAIIKFDLFLSQIPSAVLVFNLLNEKNTLIDLMAEVMGNSPWLARNLSRSPALVNQILVTDFNEPFPKLAELQEDLSQMLQRAGGAEEKLTAIRRWKQDFEFQVGIRLLKNIISHKAAAKDLSNIAMVTLSKVYDLLKPKTKGEFAIIGMGKIGLEELTFGSDLDLVFVYESAKSTDAKIYDQFVKKLVGIFSSLSEDGVMYNIDSRLRPMGEKGNLACALSAYEKYYEESAWSWEYMALTKARVLVGDENLVKKLSAIIAHHISKSYDAQKLSADMLSMRGKIAQAHNANKLWDIKYAYGGLFEAEFIIQYKILTKQPITNLGFADGLQFLKDVQSAIRLTMQGDFNEDTATPTSKARLAKSVGVKDFDSLKQKLAATQKMVHDYFNEIFKESA